LYESGRAYLKERPVSDPVARGSGAEQATGMGVLAGNFAGQRPPPAHEPHRIGCLAAGPLVPPSWRGAGAAADFFAIKGALEALATQLGAEVEVAGGEEPFLHPGRSARVSIGGAYAGWLGELHPLVCRQWDLDAATGFEIELGALAEAASLGRE